MAPCWRARLRRPRRLNCSSPRYIEGSSNNKAIEIYNGTGSAINLATGGYNIFMSFNGGTSTLTVNLSGTVASGDVYVLAHGAADAAVLAQADQLSTTTASWFNGDDAVVLRKGTTVIDAIGQIGFRPATEWGTLLISTADNTLRRKQSICAGDSNGADVFDPAVEWDGFAINTFGGLGTHTVTCALTPGITLSKSTLEVTEGGVTDVYTIVLTSAPTNDVTVTMSAGAQATTSPTSLVFTNTTYSVAQAVTVTAVDDAVVEGSHADAITHSVSSSDANYHGMLVSNVTVNITDNDVQTSPCDATYTPIYQIQGSGAAAAITGSVTTKGVVIGDYEGAAPALRGFFIQDATGDGNPATSDGIFVFNNNDNDVSLGNLVVVTGTASDFQDQTQISATATGVTVCSTGGSITPTDVVLPLASPTALEAVEGMLVRLPQTLVVTDTFQLGRFGEVTVSSGGRLVQPTNVVAPGAPALALQAANNLNALIIDDALQNQNADPIVFARGGAPLSASNTLRGGDTVTNAVGVLTYTWSGNSASGNAYRLRPINALNGAFAFVEANPRPSEYHRSPARCRLPGQTC